eukprot:10030441-Heterocapsa_arctica.AAC.1
MAPLGGELVQAEPARVTEEEVPLQLVQGPMELVQRTPVAVVVVPMGLRRGVVVDMYRGLGRSGCLLLLV